MYLKAYTIILLSFSALAQESYLARTLDKPSIIAQKIPSEPLKPASVAKLFLIGALIDKAEEQYITKIYETKDSIVLSFDIDPLFTTERLFKVIERVAALGKHKPFLDIEFPKVEGGKSRIGARAYESGVDGILFNFNSVEIVGCETPVILPLFSGFSIKRKEGEFDAECGMDSCTVIGSGGCTSKFRSVDNPKVYLKKSVEGLAKILLQKDLIVRETSSQSGRVLLAEVPGSRVKESLDALGRYSTNSIAEMLLYLLGDRKSYDLGLEKLNTYARQFSKAPIVIKDGSGLSHDTRVPVEAVVELLCQHERDLPQYLSIGGTSGTLKNRDISNTVYAKTGSLNDVSTLAGYIFTGQKKIAFAIFQQGNVSKTKEEEFIRSLVK